MISVAPRGDIRINSRLWWRPQAAEGQARWTRSAPVRRMPEDELGRFAPPWRRIARTISEDAGHRHDTLSPRFARTPQANERWRVMTKDTEALETLLDQAARARRLAIAIEGDPAAARLERLAEELEAKIVRNSFTTMQVATDR
jgi:hypothetical protein